MEFKTEKIGRTKADRQHKHKKYTFVPLFDFERL